MYKVKILVNMSYFCLFYCFGLIEKDKLFFNVGE